MKIALIGSSSVHLDEGMKKISMSIFSCLREKLCDDVLLFDPLKMSLETISNLKRFKPDLIHYIPGPSIKSFIILKTLSKVFDKTRTILSSPMPQINLSLVKLLPKLSPDLILAQSSNYNFLYNNLGLKSCFFPLSGVDLSRFHPINAKIRLSMRKRFGIRNDDFLVLHVGHMTSGRNLKALIPLLNLGRKFNRKIRVMIIGSPSTYPDQRIINFLTSKGVILYLKYITNIEYFYAMSDCYFFPTINENSCIQIPLSVLEAMAMNISVISTRFGGLVDIFPEGDGIFYLDDLYEEKVLLEKINYVQSEVFFTRQKVLKYSWSRISNRLIQLYSFLSMYSSSEC